MKDVGWCYFSSSIYYTKIWDMSDITGKGSKVQIGLRTSDSWAKDDDRNTNLCCRWDLWKYCLCDIAKERFGGDGDWLNSFTRTCTTLFRTCQLSFILVTFTCFIQRGSYFDKLQNMLLKGDFKGIFVWSNLDIYSAWPGYQRTMYIHEFSWYLGGIQS